MLTLTLERVESSCILRLWREIMRQSQTGPLESSFCLIVLTKKKSLKTNNIHSNCNWAEWSIEVPVFWIPNYHSWEAETIQNRYCQFTMFQFIFSYQVIRTQPNLGCSYFIFGVLCKLKGMLAWIRQPNANNPHLEETVLCYPSKHKHPLVTHSKQKWPMRPETSPGRQKRKHAAFKISFFRIKLIYCALPESHNWTLYGTMSLALATK